MGAHARGAAVDLRNRLGRVKPLSQPIVLLSLVAIFLLGGLSGGILVAGSAKKRVERRYEPKSIEASFDELLRKKLDLSPEKIAELKPLVDEACREYREEQTRCVEHILETMRSANSRIAAKLTPEQVEKLERLEKYHEARMRKRFGLRTEKQEEAKP